MLACELAHLTREDGPGFDPSPAVSPPALRRDSLASLAPESRGLAAEGAPRGGSGGSGPGPQPYRGLCRLLRALVGLSPGPVYLLLAATSPQGLATAESAQRHGEGAGSSSRPLFFLFFFHV